MEKTFRLLRDKKLKSALILLLAVVFVSVTAVYAWILSYYEWGSSYRFNTAETALVVDIVSLSGSDGRVVRVTDTVDNEEKVTFKLLLEDDIEDIFSTENSYYYKIKITNNSSVKLNVFLSYFLIDYEPVLGEGEEKELVSGLVRYKVLTSQSDNAYTANSAIWAQTSLREFYPEDNSDNITAIYVPNEYALALHESDDTGLFEVDAGGSVYLYVCLNINTDAIVEIIKKHGTDKMVLAYWPIEFKALGVAAV